MIKLDQEILFFTAEPGTGVKEPVSQCKKVKVNK